MTILQRLLQCPDSYSLTHSAGCGPPSARVSRRSPANGDVRVPRSVSSELGGTACMVPTSLAHSSGRAGQIGYSSRYPIL